MTSAHEWPGIDEPLNRSRLEEALSTDIEERRDVDWHVIEVAAEKWLSAEQTVERPKNLCDCERSANGLGLSGRECDCPAGIASMGEALTEAMLRKRVLGEQLLAVERELDTLSASHRELAHRLRRMGEALKPFARMADAVDAWRLGTREFMGQFDANDLRRARAALNLTA